MDPGRPSVSTDLIGKFRLARIRDLGALESGVYWPQLQPFFLKPQFRRLTYRLMDRSPTNPPADRVHSTRGASGVGELDVAYIRDRMATSLVITQAGLPDYCLTSVSKGGLACSGTDTAGLFEVGESVGLIYRGLPGLKLAATGDHERLAIWIPAASLHRRLAALLGKPAGADLVFEPVFAWDRPATQSLRHLLSFLTEELGSPDSFSDNDIACWSFTDLLLYTMLRAVPHNYSEQIANAAQSPIPAMVRRAEAFIRVRARQPIALHEVADAAECSLRTLHRGFREFRQTTPAMAILRARLDSVRQALAGGNADSLADVARAHGFTNPARFNRLYEMTFGVPPLAGAAAWPRRETPGSTC
jgi:AraC-like DNA-binding protein